ncbi:MAG TPA: apolipoprotein N-acyltransferase [Burkholderiales bacterium]|nr:apolipoprotein N-acyltransferase [Burkholderiales bacterium]
MKAFLQSPLAAIAAALAAGALTVAGFAPPALFPLPFLTLACLLFFWLRAATPQAAFRTGFAFGAGLFGVGASWVYVSLHDFGMMPAPLAAIGTFAYCAILSLYPAAAGWCLARLRLGRLASALFAFPALWTFFEWLRGWVFTGVSWLALGYSQVDSPLAGFAPVVGTYGVSFVTALCAGLLVVVVAGSGKARVAGGVALVFAFGLGQLARQIEWTSPQGTPLKVALLQGNIPQDLKFQPDRYAATLATYKRLIEASQGQLIVLPETAVPRFLDTVDPGYLRDIARIALERRADILVGVPIRDPDGRYFNSVISVGTSPSQRYDKAHLVPFGEFVPPGFSWIVKTFAIPLSDFSLGPKNPKPLALAGQRVAPNICWEDAFGEEIIRQLPEATLLVNVSNVAWFGDSLAPAQHLQISRMRALETGRAMLRATNTGVTAIIDPRGKVVARLPQFTEGILEGEVRGYVGASPYVRFGNYPIVLACLALIAALAFHHVRIVGRVGESR